MKNIYCVICGKYRKFEKPKIYTFSKKHWFFILFAVSERMKIKRYF